MNLPEIWNEWAPAALCFSPIVLVLALIAIKRESENRRVKRQVEEWESYRLKMQPVLEQERELAYLPVEKAQAALDRFNKTPRTPYEAAQREFYKVLYARKDQHWNTLMNRCRSECEYQAQAQDAMRNILLEDLRMAQDEYNRRSAEIGAERAEIDAQLSRAREVLRSRLPQPPYIPTEEEILAEQQALFAASTMMALGGMMMSDQRPFNT